MRFKRYGRREATPPYNVNEMPGNVDNRMSLQGPMSFIGVGKTIDAAKRVFTALIGLLYSHSYNHSKVTAASALSNNL